MARNFQAAAVERINILALLESATDAGAAITVLDRDGQRTLTFAELWERSGHVAAALRRYAEPGQTIGAVLGASVPCTLALVGALRAGLTLASFPTRARAMSAEQYGIQLHALCELSGAVAVMADQALRADGALPVPIIAYEDLAAAREQGEPCDGGRLVQFTSGSTAHPKGIVLPLDRVGANVRSVIAAYGTEPGDSVCSWLPLSHDMGLIGAFFATWAAGAHLTLLDPLVFVADPSIWMRTCAETAATHTWGPNFGYALATRTVRWLEGGSVASLRASVVGAEPVQASTLRAFAEAMAPLGFDPQALLPAYGLAEATLGVSCQPRDELWRSARVDPVALGNGEWLPAAEGSEIVSVGRALPGMTVRLAPGGGDCAEIEVAGPSLLERYLGAELDLDDGEWLRTGDLGTIVDGRLYVTGRLDDLLIVGGRNMYARDLELAAGEHPAIREGNCIATQRTDGRYVIVAERRRDVRLTQVREAESWIQRELAVRFGAAPADVAIIEPGALPKTASGKLARHRTASLYEQGDLARAG